LYFRPLPHQQGSLDFGGELTSPSTLPATRAFRCVGRR
jgi:hypothetical protein